MRAGELRHFVAIQTRDDTSRSAFGNVKPSWSTAASVYMSIEPLSGDETLTGEQVKAGVTHRGRMRVGDDITPTAKMQVLFETREFGIVSALNRQERGIGYELMLKEEAL